MDSRPVRVGIFGTNGHQIHRLLKGHPRAFLAAAAGVESSRIKEIADCGQDVRFYTTCQELVSDPQLDLISLCSPRRDQQAQHALAALRAGKHVYAEKPCALTICELDEIVRTAQEMGKIFHEMSGTAFAQPYLGIQELIRSNAIGEVVQVHVQKSYPWHDHRPQDEGIDGGLVRQVAIHGIRLIEQAVGLRITETILCESSLGNPAGNAPVAAILCLRLANGGVASITANYLNQLGSGQWGNDELRVFGTRGLIESFAAATRTRWVVGQRDCGAVPCTQTSLDFADLFIREIQENRRLVPLSILDELHPTRVVVAAKESGNHARPNGQK